MPFWLNDDREIVNDQNNNTIKHDIKHWGRTNFTTLTSLTLYVGRGGVC